MYATSTLPAPLPPRVSLSRDDEAAVERIVRNMTERAVAERPDTT